MSSTTTAVRQLVACAACGRQFDAAGFAAGSRFHCACGEVVVVPRVRVHDAAVVRCSSCSAPRARGAAACAHCGADYTLHERDLHTVCPSCMTRVSDRARYCHHCATPIVPQGSLGRPTDRACPACGKRHKMNSRGLGDPPLSVMECPRCAGLWLSADAFKVLADRARDAAVADPAVLVGGAPGEEPDPAPGRPTAFYRRCPTCGAMMNRRNFGKRSGVLIDACREHGLWFDARELGAVLRWIRAGGEQRAAARQADETRHAERKARIRVGRPTEGEGPGSPSGSPLSIGPASGEGLGGLLGLLFDL